MPRFTLSSTTFAAVAAALILLAAAPGSVLVGATVSINCVPDQAPNDKCTVNELAELRQKILELHDSCASEGSDHKFDNTELDGRPEWMKLEIPTLDRRTLRGSQEHGPEPFEQAVRRLDGTCPAWVWGYCSINNIGIQYQCCILTNGACTYCSQFPEWTRRMLEEAMMGEEEDGQHQQQHRNLQSSADIIPYLPKMAETCTKGFKEIVKSNANCLGDFRNAECHVIDVAMA
eukprot:CAMPEP_0119551924 /NCGR_PEP_ID=MMETSP1352-20130426/5049_1 /TAXON_ID=265584 /ORGANISM="Stauroneis constricta, Strain CCMP1120" /LENGTH=231 /DNA_ID=CAMNT_0007598053 /DNA_START=148 /DNA_END=843 /DNA_ORIENTATION=+